MSNYRDFYENALNVEISSFFEVHHIDLNRENNCIENLVAIPKDLHNQYHKYRGKLIDEGVYIYDCGSLLKNNRGYNSYIINQLIELNKCIDLINDYIDFRDYKLGVFPMYYSGKKYY